MCLYSAEKTVLGLKVLWFMAEKVKLSNNKTVECRIMKDIVPITAVEQDNYIQPLNPKNLRTNQFASVVFFQLIFLLF